MGKKNLKVLAVTTACFLTLSLPFTSFAATNDELVAETHAQVLAGETVTYDDASDIARLVQLGYACNQSGGPISITQGTLTYKNYWWTETKDIYLVCLSGTDTDAENQTTDYWTDLLAGFEFDNQYEENVRNMILDHIPAGSNIFLAGHSLGGMVAQQVAADETIKNNYNILNTVTFGSPLIDGLSREGMVKRLGDTSDIIPYASVSTVYNIVWQAAGLNREDGGYGSDHMTAHSLSYQREDVWGAYDCGGEKNGSRVMVLNFATTSFYYSPVIVTE